MSWKRDGRGTPPLGAPGGDAMRGVGVGGALAAIFIVVVLMYTGVIDPETLFRGISKPPPAATPPPDAEGETAAAVPDDADAAADDDVRPVVEGVLDDTAEVWQGVFEKLGRTYDEPVVVTFQGKTSATCGAATPVTGPLYCADDQKLYLDLALETQLGKGTGATSGFAQAYVIAHEVGHHVQNLLGITQKVAAARQQAVGDEETKLLESFEQQADCLAGVWAHQSQRLRGLIDAAKVDDELRALGAFESSDPATRVESFHRGSETGDVTRCTSM